MLKSFFGTIPFLPCNYACSGYIEKDHRRIMNGDLWTVGKPN